MLAAGCAQGGRRSSRTAPLRATGTVKRPIRERSGRTVMPSAASSKRRRAGDGRAAAGPSAARRERQGVDQGQREQRARASWELAHRHARLTDERGGDSQVNQ